MNNSLDLSLSAILFIAYGFGSSQKSLRIVPRQQDTDCRFYDRLYGLIETGRGATPVRITHAEEMEYE